MKKLLKFSLLLGVIWIFIGCAPKFSENSPVYYDEETKLVKIKQGACALPIGTKLDLSALTSKQKNQYLSRFNLNNAPDFCYNNQVSQITMYMEEINYNIFCTCKKTKKIKAHN